MMCSDLRFSPSFLPRAHALPRSTGREQKGVGDGLVMGLLNPSALIFFAIVPALVLAYLARERPSRVTVSSVLAFRAIHAMRKERFGGMPKFDWTFFVELLILSLAVLAMARPYLIRHSQSDRGRARQLRRDAGAYA